MEAITPEQFTEVLDTVALDDIATACANFLSLTNGGTIQEVVYKSIYNQLPEYVDENGFLNDMPGLCAGVITHLATEVQYKVA